MDGQFINENPTAIFDQLGLHKEQHGAVKLCTIDMSDERMSCYNDDRAS